MTRDDAAALLDLVLAKAPVLRERGVLELDIDGSGMTLRLAPHEPPPAPDDLDEDEDDEPGNPFFDPATYGRRGGVPGARAKRKRDE